MQMDSSDLDPHLINGSLGSLEFASKGISNSFCGANVRDRQTNTQTDHATPSVATARILRSAWDVA